MVVLEVGVHHVRGQLVEKLGVAAVVGVLLSPGVQGEPGDGGGSSAGSMTTSAPGGAGSAGMSGGGDDDVCDLGGDDCDEEVSRCREPSSSWVTHD